MYDAMGRADLGAADSRAGSKPAVEYMPSMPVPAQLAGPSGVAAWSIYAVLVLLLIAVAVIWLIDPRQLPLPSCWFHRITGLYCPGCGATRATHDMLHGDIASALRHNALWTLGLPLALYAAASETLMLLGRRPLWGNPSRRSWLVCTVACVAVAFFLLRNIPLWPFVLLVPAH
jgi:hypothetical protein